MKELFCDLNFECWNSLNNPKLLEYNILRTKSALRTNYSKNPNFSKDQVFLPIELVYVMCFGTFHVSSCTGKKNFNNYSCIHVSRTTSRTSFHFASVISSSAVCFSHLISGMVLGQNTSVAEEYKPAYSAEREQFKQIKEETIYRSILTLGCLVGLIVQASVKLLILEVYVSVLVCMLILITGFMRSGKSICFVRGFGHFQYCVYALNASSWFVSKRWHNGVGLTGLISFAAPEFVLRKWRCGIPFSVYMIV